jgi:hypothetical protein
MTETLADMNAKTSLTPDELTSARNLMLAVANAGRDNHQLPRLQLHDRLNAVAQYLAAHNAQAQSSAHLPYGQWAGLMADNGMPDVDHWECTGDGGNLQDYPTNFMNATDGHQLPWFNLDSHISTHIGFGIAKNNNKWYIFTEHTNFPPVNQALCGDYVSVDTPKNDWHYVTISPLDAATMKWSNRAGRSWTLTTTRQSTTLDVGNECPYFNEIKNAAGQQDRNSYHRQVTVIWTRGDGLPGDTVVSLLGPGRWKYVKN